MPPSTIWAQSVSYSSRVPSTQWMAAGCVSRAIFSTHFKRWVFRLSGCAGSRPRRDESFWFDAWRAIVAGSGHDYILLFTRSVSTRWRRHWYAADSVNRSV